MKRIPCAQDEQIVDRSVGSILPVAACTGSSWTRRAIEQLSTATHSEASARLGYAALGMALAPCSIIMEFAGFVTLSTSRNLGERKKSGATFDRCCQRMRLCLSLLFVKGRNVSKFYRSGSDLSENVNVASLVTLVCISVVVYSA